MPSTGDVTLYIVSFACETHVFTCFSHVCAHTV